MNEINDLYQNIRLIATNVNNLLDVAFENRPGCQSFLGTETVWDAKAATEHRQLSLGVFQIACRINRG